MKLKINKNKLLKSLQLANNFTDDSNINPILSGILFKITDDKLLLTSSNLNSYSQITLINDFNCDTKNTSFLTKGKLLYEIITNLSSNEIILEIIDESTLRISDNNFSCNLNLLSSSSYPAISFDCKDWLNFEISKKILLKISNKMPLFVSLDTDKKSTLGEILFDSLTEENKIKILATDSSHLFCFEDQFNGNKTKFTLSPKLLSFINSLCIDTKSDVINFYLKNNKIIIKNDNNLFFYTLSELNYPSTTKVFTREYPNIFKINKTTLINALNRAFPLATAITQDNDKNSIKFTIKNNSISILSRSVNFGECYEEIPITESNINKSYDFKINVKFLSHIIKCFDNDIITFNFNKENHPILFTDEKDPTIKFIIMPLVN